MNGALLLQIHSRGMMGARGRKRAQEGDRAKKAIGQCGGMGRKKATGRKRAKGQ